MALGDAMKVSNVPPYQELARRIGLQRMGQAIGQLQVAEITRMKAGPGWSLHAKTGWQNAPGPSLQALL